MICAQCQAESPDDASFCRSCGASLADRIVIDFDSLAPEPLVAATTSPSPYPNPPTLPPPSPPPHPLGHVPPPPPQYAGTNTAYAPQRNEWIGPVFAMLGGAAIVVGSLVEWVRSSTFGGGDGKILNAFQMPFAFLFNYRTESSGAKFGILLVALGVLGAGLSALPNVSWPRRLCGVVALAVVAAYVIQWARELSELRSTLGTSTNIFDILGAGVYITAVGALVMIAVPGRHKQSTPTYPSHPGG
jgi:hypothetical protein